MELAENNFKFDEMAESSQNGYGKKCCKRRNCSLRAVFPFPQRFQNTCTTDM